MKKINYLLGIALLSLVALPMSAQVSNDNEDGVNKVGKHQQKDYVPGQVLFKLKEGQQANIRRAGGIVQSAGISNLDAVLKEYGVKEMEQLLPQARVTGTPRRAQAFNGSTIIERDLTQLYKVVLSEEKIQNTMQMVEQLKALPEVEFAEPNYRVYVMDTHIADSYSDNPMVSQQWYLDAYGVKDLWNKPIINDQRPVIAIIDTGVDLTHPDLVDNLWTNKAEAEGEANYDNDGNGFKGDVHGWDFINNTPNIRDNNMHGTHVAGIAAAVNNGVGIVGANPQALIMPISVLQSDGTGDIATVIKGIDYAVANGATVINLSLGTYANSRALRQSLERAYPKAVIVAAAGNDGMPIEAECGFPSPMFPAAYSFVLGVMATTQSNEIASFSNYDCNGPNYSGTSSFQDPDGYNYELKAPGINILSTIPGGKYKELNGTSMATPLVSGAISVLEMVKEYNNQEILWGDLLHTDNIAQAYSLIQRPAELDILKVQLQDRKDLSEETEEDYSGDHEIDAGEIVRVYPVIRTTFGEASNIKLKLEMGDEFEDPNIIEIITSTAEFGWHLDAYGRNVSLNPLVFKVPNNVADNRRIKLKIVATCDESSQAFEKPFTIAVTNMIKINGIISEDMTLTPDHVYLVNTNLGVPSGVTLTIKPGTTLKFRRNTGISNSGTVIAEGKPDSLIIMTGYYDERWQGFSGSGINSKYCQIGSLDRTNLGDMGGILENCIIHNSFAVTANFGRTLYKCNLIDCNYDWRIGSSSINNCNIVNNSLVIWGQGSGLIDYSQLKNVNYFNNFGDAGDVKDASFGVFSNTPTIVKLSNPSYLGTSDESIIRPHIYEIGNTTNTYGQADLSNILKQPLNEAHGIVWKILVNGKDAQDEYEDLAPLGVGKHKFEIYFNRPMNKAAAPRISFGIRDPYTQQVVNEDGSWNEEGTIYTAYKSITGKTKSDGVNRIYVYGAEDNEHFEIPYEKTRFNINVQAAGSMATGFAAEAGMGRVKLTWDNSNNSFDDAMGFNIYRYTYVEKDSLDRWGNNTGKKIIVPDTIRVNSDIVDIEATEFTDYDVTPGETYYYIYKVLSTDLKEYDVSNAVSVTPLTAKLGDANGSGDVDVADVITTVNYAAGMEPKPFIFEAADINTDKTIDIIDVVGIIQRILNPSAAPALASVENTAIYTIENGVLYVESPVALAGVQVQLNMTDKKDITTTEDLNGFEQVSAWLSDNDFLFLAYNMNGKTLTAGKHALLKIGDADISQIRLSDAQGRNVTIVAGEGTTGIDVMGSKVQLQGGVFNLKGQKVASKSADLQKLPKGVYIINGEKVVK